MGKETFYAWAAGFFDGEGCVLIELSKEKACKHGYRTSLHATVTQTSVPCLELFLDEFGGSIVSSQNKTPNGRRWAVQYRWSVRNENALAFLKTIYPYAVVKREQIEVALKYQTHSKDGKKFGNKSNPIPDEVMKARLELRKLLQNIRASMKTEAGDPNHG
jgi:hypothetical protein